MGDTNTMKDFGLVRDPVFDVYYIYLGNVAVGFDPYDSELWTWDVERRDGYHESETKLLW